MCQYTNLRSENMDQINVLSGINVPLDWLIYVMTNLTSKLKLRLSVMYRTVTINITVNCLQLLPHFNNILKMVSKILHCRCNVKEDKEECLLSAKLNFKRDIHF